MIHREDGIILDRDYAGGLLAAAVNEGYVTFRRESEHDKELSDSYISRARRSRLRRKSLALALLFEKVYLNDPYELAVLEPLQREGVIDSWKLLYCPPTSWRKLGIPM